MDTKLLREQAKEAALRFLHEDGEYRMGYIEAEKPHPMTRKLSQTYASSAKDGAKLLLSVDKAMSQRAYETLMTPEYAQFAEAVIATLRRGNRVIFSGCGSSGRLSMGLERMWLRAIDFLSQKHPDSASKLNEKRHCVGNIMTGGDYAVIRAAESFEDSTALGKLQAKIRNLQAGDLLVGVTATGETTSILGTAQQALQDGAQVYMLICADHKPLIKKMARAREVYTHPNCATINLPCGPMALTGSTRMQSSTFEQFVAGVALEAALFEILRDCGEDVTFPGYNWYGAQFTQMIGQLLSDSAVDLLAKTTDTERNLYENGGLITLFADEYLLDVLTDTTERSPTFMTPPFSSADMANEPQSWAFVKNPTCSTEDAWTKCFLRRPNCIDWPRETYESLGMTENQIERIPDVSTKALYRFIIGNEAAPERENTKKNHALWIDTKDAPAEFYAHAQRYQSASQLTLSKAQITLPETATDLYSHLCIKLMMNTLSTGVMASMGRIHGNWMTCLAISNKKLVDRGARIVSDLCGITYEQALEENFYSRLLSEEQNLLLSPVQESIQRLGLK